MIILKKEKNYRIIAEKNKFNGLYDVYNQGRQIFGGWDSILLNERLTYTQIKYLKEKIANM